MSTQATFRRRYSRQDIHEEPCVASEQDITKSDVSQFCVVDIAYQMGVKLVHDLTVGTL